MSREEVPDLDLIKQVKQGCGTGAGGLPRGGRGNPAGWPRSCLYAEILSLLLTSGRNSKNSGQAALRVLQVDSCI